MHGGLTHQTLHGFAAWYLFLYHLIIDSQLRLALSCYIHADQCIVCLNGLVGIHILPTVLGSLVSRLHFLIW